MKFLGTPEFVAHDLSLAFERWGGADKFAAYVNSEFDDDVRRDNFIDLVGTSGERNAALLHEELLQYRSITVTGSAPPPAEAKGFWRTLGEENRWFVDLAQMRWSAPARERTWQRAENMGRGLVGAATDIAILTQPGDLRYMGAADRTMARGKAVIDSFGGSVGKVVAGGAGLIDAGLLGHGNAGEAAAYALQGTVETGLAIGPAGRLRGLRSGTIAAENIVATEARGGAYVLRDFEGNVVRSGRTKDLLSRRGDHLRDPLLKDYDFDPVYRTDVYAEQRGLEQILHDTHQPSLGSGPIDLV